MGNILFCAFVIICLYFCYHLVHLEICVNHIDDYLRYYSKIAKEHNLDFYYTNKYDNAPCERTYHFVGAVVNVEVNSIQAKRILKKLKRNEISIEQLHKMSTWEYSRIPK